MQEFGAYPSPNPSPQGGRESDQCAHLTLRELSSFVETVRDEPADGFPLPLRERVREGEGGPLAPLPDEATTAHHISWGEFTIQGMPNWSTHMPKPFEKNVLANGMVTVPPSASALKRFSASAGSWTCKETEKPCGFW
jgi:hypothetical protein